jgi:hypothetical protein
MDQARAVDKERLRENMEQTRASIRDTVVELRGRVSDAVDWRQHVGRHPAAGLAIAAAAGLLLGRGLAALTMRDGEEGEYGQPYEMAGYRGAEVYQGESTFAAAPRAARSAFKMAEPALAGARRAVGHSVARLGSRAEGILDRLIDEMTDAVESTLVPALIDRFRRLIDIDRRGPRGAVGPGGEGRFREERASPGGPAGPQHYPTQGRTAEQA